MVKLMDGHGNGDDIGDDNSNGGSDDGSNTTCVCVCVYLYLHMSGRVSVVVSVVEGMCRSCHRHVSSCM